jgi:hypothetical protein
VVSILAVYLECSEMSLEPETVTEVSMVFHHPIIKILSVHQKR